MTKNERKRVAALVSAAEYLLIENPALKFILDHRGVPNWPKLPEKTVADKELPSGIHLRFRDVYSQLAKSEEVSEVLDDLAQKLPTKKKVN
jgi:hypothetical protein